jgi:transcriptional regulator with XRE-family HTH domain
MKKTKSKSEIDDYIGSRIRECRLSLHLTQEQLARALGVSFQQVQNYEKGASGITAVRLFSICKILNVSLTSMFPPEHPKGFHPQPKLLNGVERRLAPLLLLKMEEPSIQSSVILPG